MSESMFRAEGLVMRFRRKTVLDQLSLDVPRGEVTVLLGPNGAGKTTLFRLALGLLVPQAGRIRVQGLDPVRQSRKLRQQTGFVPSVPDAYPWMCVADLLSFLRPQYPAWDPGRAAELVDMLAVPRATPFKDLSRGEGMKAMLAAALAPSPELLLLDEPFAGLDPVAREDVLRGVIASLKEEGRTVICATHDLDVTARIADRVAVLKQGRIRSYGPIGEILPDTRARSGVTDQLHDLLVGVPQA